MIFGLGALALIIVGLVGIMVFRYFVRISRENVVLGHHDREQGKRIEAIEKKNGHEQYQIDELKLIVVKLEKKVEQLERIIIQKDGQIEGLQMAIRNK